MKNRVLVLMASFNGENFIRSQLESIFSQKGVEVFILISDDISSDRTVGIIKEFIDRNFQAEILPIQKKFGSAASNFYHLIKNCKLENFDYVAFSDQDDIWLEDKLCSAINQIEAQDAYGFSSDVIAFWDKTGKKQLVKKSYPQKTLDFWFESPGPGCSQVFKVEKFIEFQEFVINNHEEIEKIDYHDWISYAFYRHKKYKWIISNKPKMLYRQHANNQLGANTGFKALTLRIKKIQINWYREQIERIYTILSGRDDLLSAKLIIKNYKNLRRKNHQSILLAILIVFKIL